MITTIALAASLLTMLSSWLLARGALKAVYLLGLVNGSLLTVLNLAVAARSPEQLGVAALTIPSAWGVAMSVKGLVRLSREPARTAEAVE